MALSAEAGWNQTDEDWAVFFAHGKVYGITDAAGAPQATGAVLPYAGGFAWIGMVLVTVACRRKGLGTRILEACLADLDDRGLVPFLDATPAGAEIYRPLGFEDTLGLTRWRGSGGATGGGLPNGMRAMTEDDLAAAVALDAVAFGTERRFLLDNLFRRAGDAALLRADGTGFALARSGRTATQIGPIVAGSEESAAALLETALGRVAGAVIVDLADRWTGLAGLLEARGFARERPFLRMVRGRAAPFGDPDHLFVAAGPEFG
ncbi:GNAT family N-acetyltransferase [Chelatococcus sp. GCM10030263]|uniref:GNAT family N-acetyltransferase n=1 Tax=Chelatococcus sp. GCM10030263 TaxID=3273387 RepID=UPI003615E1AC